MFQKIQQLIDDKEALVFVLIDEVRLICYSAADAVRFPSGGCRVCLCVESAKPPQIGFADWFVFS